MDRLRCVTDGCGCQCQGDPYGQTSLRHRWLWVSVSTGDPYGQTSLRHRWLWVSVSTGDPYGQTSLRHRWLWVSVSTGDPLGTGPTSLRYRWMWVSVSRRSFTAKELDRLRCGTDGCGFQCQLEIAKELDRWLCIFQCGMSAVQYMEEWYYINSSPMRVELVVRTGLPATNLSKLTCNVHNAFRRATLFVNTFILVRHHGN